MDNDFILLEHGDSFSDEQLEKLFAIKALQNNPEIVRNPFIFEKLCYAFSGIKSDFYNIEPAEVMMIAKAVIEIEKIIPGVEWGYEVRWYIAYSAFEEGWVKLPKCLEFAQDELNELNTSDYEDSEEIQAMQKLKHDAVEKWVNHGESDN